MTPPPDPTAETIPPGEAGVIADLVALLDGIQRAAGATRRSQHPKGHGCLEAAFRVRDDVPAALRHGLFARPARFAAWVRVSNAFTSDDRLPDYHGFAIKLLDGGPSPAGIADLILIDAPVFFTVNPRTLLAYFRCKVGLLAGGATPDAVDRTLAAEFPRETALLGRYTRPGECPFGSTFWSVVPYRLGPHAVKYRLAPDAADPGSTRPADGPDAVRAGMIRRLTAERRPARFRFEVQVRGDPAVMPVEDATVEWGAAFTPVAEVEIPLQTFATPERDSFGEGLAFDPWNIPPEHRPLGGLNRARRAAYPAGAARRGAASDVSRPPPVSPH
jgi:hypothetical protein